MNISLRQLKVFLGVASTSSFTKTAQRLHLSQAALSAIIRELETQLQCRLLDRTTRTVSMTEAGRTFFPVATHIVETMENCALELGKIGREEQRVLRVGVTPHIATSLMPAVLKRYAIMAPSVRVEMTDSAPDDLLQLVEAGDLDAAFGAFFAKASGIERTPIFPMRLVVASAEAEECQWPHFGSGEVKWQAFANVPLISFPKENPIQRLVEEYLAREQVTTGKRIEVAQLETAIAMAEAGFGVSVVLSISEAAARRFRVRLDAIEPAVELSFYCITRAGRGSIDTITQFSEAFRQVAEEFHDGPLRKGGKATRKKKPRGPSE